jgi:intracellular sulfur oxidation DsrE/DsrF family protein
MDVKLVLHIDENESSRLNIALINMVNLLKEVEEDNTNACILTNGPAANLLKNNMPKDVAGMITNLHKKGVRFYACNNSLEKFDIAPNELHPRCEVVKAGILKLIELQNEGYAYVKP